MREIGFIHQSLNPSIPEFLTLRVSPPAHPETMPRGVELIREVGEHTEGQRAWETVVPQEGENG